MLSPEVPLSVMILLSVLITTHGPFQSFTAAVTGSDWLSKLQNETYRSVQLKSSLHPFPFGFEQLCPSPAYPPSPVHPLATGVPSVLL